MSTLPPLPEPEYPAVRLGINGDKLAYTADQMRAYGAACAAAEREALSPLSRLWPIIERSMKGYVFTADRAGEVAADMNAITAAIRARGET